MRESLDTAAHVTQVWEVDLGRVTEIRSRLKPKFQQDYGVNLSFLPFIMRAAVEKTEYGSWQLFPCDLAQICNGDRFAVMHSPVLLLLLLMENATWDVGATT